MVHSDASFIVEWDGKSNFGGVFYLGWHQRDDKEQKINGTIEVTASVLPLVVILVAEAEMGGAFYNGKKAMIFRLPLDEMGYKQGPTTIYVDNNTASGICNNTINRQRSRSMNGQNFWLIDQVKLGRLRIVWAPGLENRANYFTKHFPAAHHRAVRPYYVHMPNLPRTIRKVIRETNKTVSARLRGCVDVPAKTIARERTPLVWTPV